MGLFDRLPSDSPVLWVVLWQKSTLVVSLSDEPGKTADHSDASSWGLKKTACISGRRRMGSVSVSPRSDFAALLAHLSSPETSDGEQRCMVLKSMA